jgi:hypothetical protein
VLYSSVGEVSLSSYTAGLPPSHSHFGRVVVGPPKGACESGRNWGR